MTIQYTHEADGIDLLVSPISFDPGTASTMIGAVVKAYAKNTKTGQAYAGTATVVSATSIRAIFTPGSIPEGLYSVQVIATPDGYQPQTIYDEQWRVKASAGTA